MAISRTKSDVLSELDPEYLRDLAHHLNSSARDYSYISNERLVERVSEKLTVEQVDAVFESYNKGHSPVKAADKVSPPEVSDFQQSLESMFECAGLNEVKIGKKYCDFVVPKSITAIEIKTARDRLDRAIEQVAQYRQWADFVYLAFDESHRDSIPQIIESSDVGLLQYTQDEVIEADPAECTEVDSGNRLNWMTYDKLSTVARSYNVSPRGGKSKISKSLDVQLSEEELDYIFIDYLYNRS
jgi:hypothetical protein